MLKFILALSLSASLCSLCSASPPTVTYGAVTGTVTITANEETDHVVNLWCFDYEGQPAFAVQIGYGPEETRQYVNWLSYSVNVYRTMVTGFWVDMQSGNDVVDLGDANTTYFPNIRRESSGPGKYAVKAYARLGSDWITLSDDAASWVDLGSSQNEYADFAVGSTEADYIYGGDTNDIIHCNSGNDVVFGYEGNDWLYGADGYDIIYCGVGLDTAFSGSGGDLITGDGSVDWVYLGNDCEPDYADMLDWGAEDYLYIDIDAATFYEIDYYDIDIGVDNVGVTSNCY